GRRVRCVAITMTSERKIMRREDCYVCYKHILSCEASIFVQCALGSSTGTLSSDFGTFVGERTARSDGHPAVWGIYRAHLWGTVSKFDRHPLPVTAPRVGARPCPL